MVIANECHQGLVELARCRSDLFSASSVLRRAINTSKLVSVDLSDSGTGWHRARRHGLVTHMKRIKRFAPREHCPQDAGVVVCQRHHRPSFSCRQPQRSRRASAHCEIGSLRRCAVSVQPRHLELSHKAAAHRGHGEPDGRGAHRGDGSCRALPEHRRHARRGAQSGLGFGSASRWCRPIGFSQQAATCGAAALQSGCSTAWAAGSARLSNTPKARAR